ncbi:recA-like protein [Erythrobacter sp.]|nr:recA-like protein [Erythrobacter sp.]
MPDMQSSSGAKALQTYSVPSRPRASGLARLSTGDIAALGRAREGRWQPGLSDQPLHSEIFASTSDGSGAGVALALARDALRLSGEIADPLADAHDRRQVLWVQDKHSVRRGGRPYAQGLPAELRERVIHVEAATAQDALFALEEGLRCRDLACVIGEISGNPRALDFTASRRLSLAAEKHGVPLWLVRLDAAPELSSARIRWRSSCAPSPHPLLNSDAPGAPEWRAELFRARSHAPGEWILSNDDGSLRARHPSQIRAANTQDHGDLVRPTFGRSLAAFARM